MGQGISYASRMAIKSKVLADFGVEWMDTQLPPSPLDEEYWAMFFDGSLMKEGAGLGIIFVSPPRRRNKVRSSYPLSSIK